MPSHHLAALTATALLTTGCTYYKHIEVKPEQLPRLNGSTTTVLGHHNNTTIVGVTVGRIEAKDGRVIEVRGGFNLLMGMHSKQTRFEHPVQSDVMESVLRVSGGNQGNTLFPLDEIDYAKLELVDGSKSMWATFGVILGVGLLGTAVVMTATDSW